MEVAVSRVLSRITTLYFFTFEVSSRMLSCIISLKVSSQNFRVKLEQLWILVLLVESVVDVSEEVASKVNEDLAV